MSSYKITEYSKAKAKENNVSIKPSTNKNKKIDVYKNNVKIATIGDVNYKDFPNYIKSDGLTYAKERQRLYTIRHKKDLNSSTGKWAKILLW